MTFSIVAGDPDHGAWGVAVASRYLAVGGIVPAADSTAGALATQARTNMAYRADGLAALRSGDAAEAVLAALLDPDEHRDQRQLGIVDLAGRAATWTGPACSPHAGGYAADGVAIQGNLLTGPEVVDAMARAWSAGPAADLADRLLLALEAGDAAGGDRRGRQAAALLVVRRDADHLHGSDVDVDLRVDDSARPLPELRRLLGLRREDEP